jgi:N-acyl homoserine lactone hydrolase
MGIKKLSLLPAGRCQVDQFIIDTRINPGSSFIDLPIWVYLVETTDGPILIDTGMPASCVTDPLGLFGGGEDGPIIPKMKEEDVITNILARNGYKPDDLACIVSTHLHFDHAGGNSLFEGTEIVVQQREYDAAMTQVGYPDICKQPNLHYKIITGDTKLIPGFELILTPGHSAGHQSVLLSTKESGNILLTIDAAYSRENYESNVPFAVLNQTEACASISKLKEIVKHEKAKVFFGHDIEQEKEWQNKLVVY